MGGNGFALTCNFTAALLKGISDKCGKDWHLNCLVFINGLFYLTSQKQSIFS
jgi:hypothetical protein